MVRTRIAPSPTGQDFHIGNAYTALINYIFAKQNKGRFIVRIEDTDRTRLVEGSETRILNTMNWLGLTPDEGPYRQSERKELYKKYALELINNGHAYYCFCTPQRLTEVRNQMQKQGKPPMYDGFCKKIKNSPRASLDESRRGEAGQKYVIRLNVPDEGETNFNDLIRGKVSFQNKLIDDQILLKSDGFPTYHLAVVVDDYLMKISHVIRAEEWLSSTPKHILLYNAFKWPLPFFAHLPILRNPDKSKLSKRKNPVWVSYYREQGYLPEAINNYLMTLGWTHPKQLTIFPLSEAILEFSFDRVNKSGPIFDVVKLTWMNGEYIRMMNNEELADKLYSYMNKKFDRKLLLLVSSLLKQRIKKLSEAEGLIDFFIKKPDVDLKVLIPKKRDSQQAKKVLNEVIQDYMGLNNWSTASIHDLGNKIVEKSRWKPVELFQMIRVAISGKTVTPPLFESMEILGKEETINRLETALRNIS
ncbi:glutamate--tRNA ligase [Candidatus Gottesmanbacteria bacterium]|nr:glutamate--tRNA ligase [Candidatus Gottesmanbacteria bacterium]